MLNRINMETPQTVVFTKRAFNAIVTETISKHPIETGGIFLGYLLDNDTWIVIENVSPGFKSTHRSAYFEYDTDFVTYLANVLANQYKGNLRILGLWHRHPGSMDIFSSTDEQTNRNYASDCPQGAISALVNCDPKMRMTMYHVAQNGQHQLAEWYVDDGDIIPQELLELRYTSIDELPTFNSEGVVHSSENNDNEGGVHSPENNDNEKLNVESEPVAAPQVQRKPYKLVHALKDIKKIINQLFTGYTNDN